MRPPLFNTGDSVWVKYEGQLFYLKTHQIEVAKTHGYQFYVYKFLISDGNKAETLCFEENELSKEIPVSVTEELAELLQALYQVGKNYGYSEARSQFQATEFRELHEKTMVTSNEIATGLMGKFFKALNCSV